MRTNIITQTREEYLNQLKKCEIKVSDLHKGMIVIYDNEECEITDINDSMISLKNTDGKYAYGNIPLFETRPSYALRGINTTNIEMIKLLK